MKLALFLIGLVVIQMIALTYAQTEPPTEAGVPVQMKYPVESKNSFLFYSFFISK